MRAAFDVGKNINCLSFLVIKESGKLVVSGTIYNKRTGVELDIHAPAEGQWWYVWYSAIANIAKYVWYKYMSTFVLFKMVKTPMTLAEKITRNVQSNRELYHTYNTCVASFLQLLNFKFFVFSSWFINEYYKAIYMILVLSRIRRDKILTIDDEGNENVIVCKNHERHLTFLGKTN